MVPNIKNELFDIVDKNNKSLGIKKERSLIHKEGDWHNSVHIYVFNDKNELLVHLRSPLKDLHPNCWDTRFGGHIIAGETIENTAIKELGEEIGIKVEQQDLIRGSVYKWDGRTNREFNNVFFYRWQNGNILNFNDGEVIEVKWMSKNDILNGIKENSEKWTSRSSTILKIFEEWEKLNL